MLESWSPFCHISNACHSVSEVAHGSRILCIYIYISRSLAQGYVCRVFWYIMYDSMPARSASIYQGNLLGHDELHGNGYTHVNFFSVQLISLLLPYQARGDLACHY